MKLPLGSSKRGRPRSTDTLQLLNQLGYHLTALGVWKHLSDGSQILECEGDEPYALDRGGVITHYPSLIAVYRELACERDKGGAV